MGKIYFAEGMEASTLKAINEAHDCADIANDLCRIQKTLTYGTDEEARQLDYEMRQKYPTICDMLSFSNSLSKQPSRYVAVTSEDAPYRASLWQDYYGILCHAAIKKGIKMSISDCIDHIEGP